MKKLLVTTFATTALLLAGCSDEGAEVASTEAGRIREQDLYAEMKNEPLQNGMTVGETVLQKLLLTDIFEIAYGDQVSDEDVEAEFEASAEGFNSVEEYEELLEMQGLSPDYVRSNIRLSLLMDEAVRDRVEITDEQVEQAYEAGQPQFTAQHILVEDEDLANDIIEQLEDGADFGELVTEHSQDPGSLETEGTYSFNEGEMVEEFENSVKELEEGELTAEPVETAHGFHIIRRLELDYAPLDEQREEIEQQMLAMYSQDQAFMNEIITELAEEANIQIADEDLKGAMAAFMPEPESPAVSEDDADDTEPVEEDATEEETDADAEATEEDAEESN